MDVSYLMDTATIGVPISTLIFVIGARSYCGYELLPVAKAPPCTKAMTGSRLAPLMFGAAMFSVKHSVSDCWNGENGSGFCSSVCSHSQPLTGLNGIGL